jgi:C4-dicarboxylate-specific signal transduction histidine kinase
LPCRAVWQILGPVVAWGIATSYPPHRDLPLLVAANRAAAFGVAARWVLHDIRSPAQSLTLLADLIGDPDAEVEEILRESSAHLARSLDLLSRVIHPPPPGEIGPISVREPLEFIAELHRAGRTPARLELSVDRTLPAAAGIERHLEHAVLNLVLNATEALGSRENALIRLTARSEGDGIVIEVADNGPGVPPDVAARLFQAPVTTKTGVPLAGIGLMVASEVLRASGGTLTHVSERGPGARFLISLPAWRRPAPPAS